MNFREQMADQFAVGADIGETLVPSPDDRFSSAWPTGTDLFLNRQNALELAIKAFADRCNGDEILKAAAKFEAYLLGKQD